MRRTGLVFVVLLSAVGWAGAVHAQIAAPTLNPIAIEGSILTPDRLVKPYNPAGLPWSGNSRVGAAMMDLSAEDTTAGVTTPAGTADGLMLQFRLVGEMFSVGAETYSATLEDPGGNPPSDFKASHLTVALRLGDMLSVGVAQQMTEFSNAGGGQSQTLPVVGLTWRLGSAIFLGAAIGTETVEFTGGGTSQQTTRGVQRIGVGYLTRSADSGLHLEAYRETADAFDTGVIAEDGTQTDGITAEIIFSNILLGLELQSGEQADVGGVLSREFDRKAITVGWVPLQGLSVVASVMDEETVNQPSGNTTAVDTKIVGVAWSF